MTPTREEPSMQCDKAKLSFRHRTIRCQILSKIGDDVPGDLHGGSGPRIAGGELGINARGVVHKVSVKPGGSDLILREVAGELMDQSAHHLQMAQFLCAYQGAKR